MLRLDDFFFDIPIFILVLVLTGLAVFLFLLVLLRASIHRMTADERRDILGKSIAGLPLAVTGIIIGYLTGASREPATDALLPAALTFIGGIGIFVSRKGKNVTWTTGFVTLAFTVSLMFGVGLGANVRERHEAAENSVQALKEKADNELLVRLYRQSLRLPLDPPKPEEKEAAAKE